MYSSGIIRRVDELGRVVIPVEIRKILNIKEGENLEFIVKDDSIELKKKSIADNNSSFFKIICDKLGEVIEENYFMTDREHVLNSSNKEIINKKISSTFVNLLSVHDDSILSSFSVDFEDICIRSTFYVYPYYFENDIAGFIVLYGISNIEKYNKLIKFIISYIHDKLSL